MKGRTLLLIVGIVTAVWLGMKHLSQPNFPSRPDTLRVTYEGIIPNDLDSIMWFTIVDPCDDPVLPISFDSLLFNKNYMQSACTPGLQDSIYTLTRSEETDWAWRIVASIPRYER